MATDRLGDMRLFVEAAARGTLSAAGRQLGLSPAAASARLVKLESALKAKLFNRTTRQLRLTAEGKLYLHYCMVALQAIDDAETALQASRGEVAGKIRVSASGDFGRNQLSQWIEQFSAQYPEVKIALTLTDALSNLHQDDIDIAIRFGLPANDQLIARRLAANWRVLCASPEYLARYGTPQTPADLHYHHFIVLVTASGVLNDYRFTTGGEEWNYSVSLSDAWETNDGAMARTWALAGRGITRKTIWDASSDIKAGRLVALLPDFTVTEAGVYAVYHQTRYRVPRVRVFLDFITERFKTASAELPDFAVADRR